MLEVGQDHPERRSELRSISVICAYCAIGISAAILISWLLHAEALAKAAPFLFEMKANAALGFGAAGAALLLLARERPRAAAGLGTIALSIGFLFLGEYALGANLRFDELLVGDWAGGASDFPGRPPPNTAVALAALGIALTAPAAIPPGRVRLVGVTFICLAVIAIALAAVAGYIAGSPIAIGWGTRQQMSIPGALCALALSVGILAHRWQAEVVAIARIPVWLPALMCFAALLFDIYTPREIDAGICYIPIVFCALWFDRANVAIIFAVISTLLIVFGYFASPPGDIPSWMAAANRGLAIFAVWVVAILVHMQGAVERKLRRSAGHLAAAQRVAAVGSFELDFASMTFKGSSAFDVMQGLAPGSSRDWAAFIRHSVPPDDARAIDRMIENGRGGNRCHELEYSFLTPDGAVRNAIMYCELLYKEERVPHGMLGVVHDVTELRQAQARQADIEAQLRHAQKIEALGTLAGGVAHDLNNTLAPITILVPVMLERFESASDRRSLEIIFGAANRAKALVREILTFSRKDPAEREAIRLDLLARDTLTIIRAGVPASIDIVDALEPVPAIVGSKGQIYQTILNLATNAAQAIGNRAGTITIGVDWESVNPGAAGAWVRLFVADDGVGMDERTKARIFEPFFSTKEERGGTGLGLSIVSGIVASHGGSISVDSAPGKGTRFDLLFPDEDLRSVA